MYSHGAVSGVDLRRFASVHMGIYLCCRPGYYFVLFLYNLRVLLLLNYLFYLFVSYSILLVATNPLLSSLAILEICRPYKYKPFWWRSAGYFGNFPINTLRPLASSSNSVKFVTLSVASRQIKIFISKKIISKKIISKKSKH